MLKTTKFYSPLRYPGGKNKLAKFIALICKKNNVKGHYIEPYAGGASVALFLLLNSYVSEITINDLDRSIYAFWYAVLYRTNKLCGLIETTPVTIENWKINREIQKNKEKASLIKLGFSTFFLNRTNISGVIAGGVIGGLEQKGSYKIDCRFNRQDLIARIRQIAAYKEKIHLENLDALILIKNIQKASQSNQTIFYFDPPYYMKGQSLYVNHYRHDDHEAISKEIKAIKNSRWIVSYDNISEIKKMYGNCEKLEYSFMHTAHHAKEGKEILFFSKNLIIPHVDNPVRIPNAA